jgi:hypothetical protein
MECPDERPIAKNECRKSRPRHERLVDVHDVEALVA